MKNFIKWAGVSISTIALGLLIFYGTPLLLAFLFVAGLEAERSAMDDASQAVLNRTGLTAYAEYAPWDDLSIDGVLTVFQMPSYNNHTEEFNLHEGIMDSIESLPGWQKTAVTAEDYAALLTAAHPDAAFLLPRDITFDARFEAENELALFDCDTGLMIELLTGIQPKAGQLSLMGLTIPHNGYMYQLETHGGIHGDGDSYRACIIPEGERASFVKVLEDHADWHRGAVSPVEYATLHRDCFHATPELLPHADAAFDWWCWVDTYARNRQDKDSAFAPNNHSLPAVMRDAGAYANSLNWLVALYDEDTGLFIYYEEDS